MTIIYIICAFLAGAFFHKVYSALAIIFGLKSHLLTVVENEILTFVVKMYSRMIMTLEMGYASLRLTGVDEEKVKLLRNEDEHDMRAWRKEIIQHFVDSYPPAYRIYLNIESWEGAMEQLAAYNEFPERSEEDEAIDGNP